MKVFCIYTCIYINSCIFVKVKRTKTNKMELLENINFESERTLININDLDHNEIADGYSEEDWNISFEYNGYKLTSVIDFTLELKKDEDEDVDVISVDVTIKEMLTDNEFNFDMSTKEEIKLENRLAIELKIEF